MIVIEFIVFILSSLGLMNILINAPIAEGFRNLIVKLFSVFGNEKMGEYLVTCSTCVGVWVGVLTTFLYLYGLIMLATPFMISYICYVAALYWH